jgi:hypothetical protein
MVPLAPWESDKGIKKTLADLLARDQTKTYDFSQANGAQAPEKSTSTAESIAGRT